MSWMSSWWAALGPFVTTGLVVYGAFRFTVRPGMVAELKRVEDQVAELRVRVATDGAEGSDPDIEGSAEVAEELARTQERVTALAGILATPREAEAVLESLGFMASESGVRFLRFAPEPEYRLDGYLARAASVVAEGAFFEVLNFFERVSLSPHLVLVEDAGLELGPGGVIRCRFVAVTVRVAGVGLGSRHESAPVATGSDAAGLGGGESGC